MQIQHHPIIIIIAAIGLCILAIELRLYVGKRRFYRRNQMGLQTFPTYSHSIWATLYENFLLFISTASVIFSIILITIYYLC